MTTLYEVTEVCPHCEQEVTMVWDVETYGYHAYCPFCGKRLMLCDMCQHQNGEEQATGDCDYDSKTDTCRFNKCEVIQICPICDTEREMQTDGNKAVCPYCGTVCEVEK